MLSRAARTNDRRRTERVAAMTADERLGLVLRLAEQGLSSYMETFGVDRATAVARIKATRRLGRRRSACAHADAD
jgi:hypothetical protein